ncbi:MAG: carbohydrate ABC transporter permease [Candidatus Saganbacteria bacterium]|nr:carbohydrate ABC transporter permease [Candidatus Saganbacteria bacterium]
MKRLLRFLFIAIVLFWTFLPIYLMLKVSFSPAEEIMSQNPPLLIHSVTLDHWKDVFQSGNLWQPLTKSLTVAFSVMILALLIAAPAAYALSRISYRLAIGIILFIFFARMLPDVQMAMPVSVYFIRLGLLDANLGLILAHLIRVLPIVTWILLSVFKTIPIDIEEQAEIDGAGRFQIIKRIALPLAMPGIIVSAIFAFLFSWDEFIYAMYLCLGNKTLPLMVYYYVNRAGWFGAATFSTIIAIPVLIVTLLLQRYLKADYLAGAVKG